MKYSLSILPRAQKELSRLDDSSYGKVGDAIRDWASNARPVGCAKLTGREGWRIRVGNFRVIYKSMTRKNQ